MHTFVDQEFLYTIKCMVELYQNSECFLINVILRFDEIVSSALPSSVALHEDEGTFVKISLFPHYRPECYSYH